MINKKEAIEVIKNLLKDYNKEYTKVYISENTLETSSIKDVLDNQIFNEKQKNGYLIFVDPLTIANWSHYCEYFFIVSKDEIISNLDGKWFPSESIVLEEIKI